MTFGPLDILCLSSWNGLGGAQGNAVRLVHAFRERGYQASVGFLFDQKPAARYDNEGAFVIADKIPCSVREWSRFLTRCRSTIAPLRPRVGIGFHPLANVIGAFLIGERGRFISRQAWPASEQSRGSEFLESLLCRTPLIHANIAVSRFVASTFAHRGASYARKTQVIYNNPSALPIVEDEISPCRQKLGIREDVPIIGCIGRLHEQKNFQLAIRAMVGIPDAHLYVAGGGEQAGMLRALSAELGIATRVHFLGPLTGADVTRFYKSVELLLMPSLYEGHPMVMIEAMSIGVPVIANDVPVLREAGGEAALYCAADPCVWSEVIRATDQQKRQRLTCAGLKRAAHFARDSMVDRYLRIAGLSPWKEVA